ncbi:hypothetical protein [Lysobacter soyae]|uniref:DUF4124 domain-containing protein n=1 Tax=Lysobacter soyae TaxID=2764185 RepID=A0ABX8WPG4_9GAMM|nr:hypothetical protein [Lysobacter sp. CJ11]QYR52781.1 hypothetical protein H8L67_09415 [Lysobacter sp. CJ11]
MAALFVHVVSAQAGEVRRCRLSDGRIQYSDGPCPNGSREVWVRDAGPARVPLSEVGRASLEDTRQWQRQNRAEVSSWVSRQQAVSRAGSRGAVPVDRCAQARSRRDRIRDREFKTMTFDRAVELDNQVREQCR